MIDQIDLHIHSTHSDGILSPEEIISIALSRDLRAVSITDHDTISANPIALSFAQKKGIEFVPGVELSAKQNKHEVHILGYYIDDANPLLNKYLSFLKIDRVRRAKKILANLEQLGISIGLDEVQKKTIHGAIGRAHIAELMLEKGFVQHFGEAFYKYIGDQAEAFVPKYQLSVAETIQHIRAAGGISVVAHPTPYIIDQYLQHWIKDGLQGIEVIHPRFSQTQIEYLEALADRNNLLKTGGSDCHGKFNGERIGKFYVPGRYLDQLNKYMSPQSTAQTLSPAL